MVPLVDIHCHLDDKQFSEDVRDVVKRAKDAGIAAIMSNGISPESNRAVIALAAEYPLIRATLGLYPIDALKLTDQEIDNELAWIEEQIGTNDIAAIGEVGLDHKWSTEAEEHKRQERIFAKVLALAKKTEKTVIIHSRKAERRCFEMARDAGVRAVFHAFGGKVKLIREIRDAKFSFSIPPVVGHDEHFQRIVEEVPLNQLLTETDSPYLGPDRESRNEPANVTLTIEKIAQIKGLTPEETANQVFANYQRLFS